jgi:hypothetical protein
MKIQITSCIDSSFWYYKYIGDVFEVERTDAVDGSYWVREKNVYRALNFVLKQDAVQISTVQNIKELT